MLITISPAKTLDFTPRNVATAHTIPEFLRDSRKLNRCLRELSVDELSELMGISESLAELTCQRNREWRTPFSPANAKQAVLAFRGDVYVGLQADEWNAGDFGFAQEHLRILSGLYGVLRPLDLIQAYRLEMGTKLETAAETNLYGFWGEKITIALNKQLERLKSEVVVNLASNEYFRSIRRATLQARVVTPGFRERKNGDYRMVSFFAKKARGLMTSFCLRNRLNDPEDIKQFDVDGYRFNPDLSEGDRWMFTRNAAG